MCHHMIVFLDGSSLSWHRSNDFSGYGFPLLISNGVIGCSSTSVLHCLPQWLHFKFLTTCIWWCGAHHGNVWTVLSVAWCNSNDPAVVSWIQLLLWWTFSFVPSKFHAVLNFSTKGSWLQCWGCSKWYGYSLHYMVFGISMVHVTPLSSSMLNLHVTDHFISFVPVLRNDRI